MAQDPRTREKRVDSKQQVIHCYPGVHNALHKEQRLFLIRYVLKLCPCCGIGRQSLYRIMDDAVALTLSRRGDSNDTAVRPRDCDLSPVYFSPVFVGIFEYILGTESV